MIPPILPKALLLLLPLAEVRKVFAINGRERVSVLKEKIALENSLTPRPMPPLLEVTLVVVKKAKAKEKVKVTLEIVREADPEEKAKEEACPSRTEQVDLRMVSTLMLLCVDTMLKVNVVSSKIVTFGICRCVLITRKARVLTLIRNNVIFSIQMSKLLAEPMRPERESDLLLQAPKASPRRRRKARPRPKPKARLI